LKKKYFDLLIQEEIKVECLYRNWRYSVTALQRTSLAHRGGGAKCWGWMRRQARCSCFSIHLNSWI
jgi:hypothetical protein